MLLGHTSGIPEYSDKQLDFEAVEQPHRIWTGREFLARSAGRPRPFAPGKRSSPSPYASRRPESLLARTNVSISCSVVRFSKSFRSFGNVTGLRQGYAYSNTDYNALGLVIESATGKPWRQAVRERVIDRLGLKHTSRYGLPGGIKVIGHFGTAPGYRAFVGYAPAQKTSISIAFNARHYAPADPTPVIVRAFEVALARAA